MKRLTLVMAPALLVLVAVAALPTTQAFAEDTNTNIEQMIENAKTPSDYEAIAAYYEKKADEAEQQFKWHESLYKTYKQNPRMTTMQTHCHRLMHIYKSEAKEDRIMADQYRQIAEKAKSK